MKVSDNVESDTSPLVKHLFPIIMSMSITATSWFLNQAWSKISIVETKIQAIELKAAETGGNRFTSNNWVDAKAILDNERAALDRRIMRLEESLPVIKDTLIEIKNKVSVK